MITAEAFLENGSFCDSSGEVPVLKRMDGVEPVTERGILEVVRHEHWAGQREVGEKLLKSIFLTKHIVILNKNRKDGRIIYSLSLSEPLRSSLLTVADLVFVDPQIIKEAKVWLRKNRQTIITPPKENENE